MVGWFVSVATIRQFDGETACTPRSSTSSARASTASRSSRRRRRSPRPSPRSRRRCPVVLISSASDVPPGPHLHAVGVDQRHGARLATQHLLDQGFAEVVHVAGPQDWFDAQDRLAGWREVSGPGAPEHIEAGWDAADGYELGLRMVARGAAVGDLRGERPARARPPARVLGEGRPGAVRRRRRRVRRRGRRRALHAAADHRPAGLRGARAARGRLAAGRVRGRRTSRASRSPRSWWSARARLGVDRDARSAAPRTTDGCRRSHIRARAGAECGDVSANMSLGRRRPPRSVDARDGAA